MATSPDSPEGQTPADDILEKHAADIGFVAIAWNDLHEGLGEIFVEIISPNAKAHGRAAWEAVTSDRSKREMVRAVALSKFGAQSRWVKELIWALGQMNSLEDKRNDAVHAPYSLSLEDGALRFTPSLWSQNPRALKLRDKDLSLEFSSYLRNMAALKKFFSHLLLLIQGPMHDMSWPERPALPRPAQAQAKKS